MNVEREEFELEINKINCFSAIKLANKPNNNSPVVQNLNQKNRAELDVLAFLGKSQINKKYELGLSHEELLKRTNSDYLATKQYLSLNSPEYQNLDLGDKKALVHLVKAAKALDEIFMVQDNHHNLDFRDFLNSEIAKNNEDAKLTKILFDAQKGVCSVDNNTNQIELAKGISETRGKGFYPENLEPEQFQQILIKMLKYVPKEGIL